MSTVEARALALLGDREVRPHPHRRGVLIVQGKAHHKTGYTPMYEVDTTRWECNCPSFSFGTVAGLRNEMVAPPKSCKHVTLIQTFMPLYRVMVASGVAA